VARLPVEVFAFPLAALITWLLYGDAVHSFFLTDDFVWVVIARDATSDLWRIFTLEVSNAFRPLAHLVNTAVYAAWGPSPEAFHAAALLLHAANAALLARLTLLLGRDRWLALASVLIFALNPAYYEVVLWISSINESLNALLVLSTLIAWVRVLEAPSARGRYLAALLCFVAAAGAKESWIVILPLMVLVQAHLRVRLSLLLYAPFAALWIAYLAAQYHLQQKNGLVLSGQFVFGPGMLAVLWRTARYLVFLHWPLLAVVLAALAFSRRRRVHLQRALRPVLLLSAAFVVAVMPYAPVTWNAGAARFFYLPSLALAILAALAVKALATAGAPLPRAAALAALTGYVALNTFATDPFVSRHLDYALTSKHFVDEVRELPSPVIPLSILDCPFGRQHMSAVTRLYHPSGSARFHAITRDDLMKLQGQRWIWRWYPAHGRFMELEDSRR